ncbi:hypothetical protein SCUP515_13120 [Seiridium cupressi]
MFQERCPYWSIVVEEVVSLLDEELVVDELSEEVLVIEEVSNCELLVSLVEEEDVDVDELSVEELVVDVLSGCELVVDKSEVEYSSGVLDELVVVSEEEYPSSLEELTVFTDEIADKLLDNPTKLLLVAAVSELAWLEAIKYPDDDDEPLRGNKSRY